MPEPKLKPTDVKMPLMPSLILNSLMILVGAEFVLELLIPELKGKSQHLAAGLSAITYGLGYWFGRRQGNLPPR